MPCLYRLSWAFIDTYYRREREMDSKYIWFAAGILIGYFALGGVVSAVLGAVGSGE